ncbi:PLD nuclease N-terminal domain-containing protein [Geomobilimonas luticola]|uniref:PLDc N-terminal domain-containing protein n=1 Tax=Geomobilimonas luticola TaxID=1114878 RepID=A0ABS5SCI4_9BACT|nr:PLD nuclease N-terminal domain-containing protein [Geomobilimonas luticola]MBT0653083.1 PLDc N-terminal domain-containing protein [Geomobilimonas luticola]
MGIIEIGLLVQLIAWIAAVVAILRNSSMKGGTRFMWLLAVFLLPVVGVVAYFLFGRQRTSDRRSDDISPMDIHHTPPDPGSTDDFSSISHD